MHNTIRARNERHHRPVLERAQPIVPHRRPEHRAPEDDAPPARAAGTRRAVPRAVAAAVRTEREAAPGATAGHPGRRAPQEGDGRPLPEQHRGHQADAGTRGQADRRGAEPANKRPCRRIARGERQAQRGSSTAAGAMPRATALLLRRTQAAARRRGGNAFVISHAALLRLYYIIVTARSKMGNCLSDAQWFDAARKNDVDAICALSAECLRSYERRNRPGKGIFRGFTALMYASFYNHAQLIHCLFDEEKYMLLREPVSAPIVSSYKVIEGFVLPQQYSALQVAIVAGAVDATRALLNLYSYSFFERKVARFQYPHDLLSLIIISNMSETLTLIQEFCDIFKRFFLPSLDNVHLNLACVVGNEEFITLVLRMANSERYSRFVAQKLRAFSCLPNDQVVQGIPTRLLACDETVNICRQRCLNYQLGNRETPVPSWMGRVLPQPNIRCSRFVSDRDAERGSYYFDSTEHREQKMQVFRVRSCGALFFKEKSLLASQEPEDSGHHRNVEKDSQNNLRQMYSADQENRTRGRSMSMSLANQQPDKPVDPSESSIMERTQPLFSYQDCR